MQPPDVFQIRDSIKEMLEAAKKLHKVGLLDHLDCCGDGGQFWHDAIEGLEKSLETVKANFSYAGNFTDNIDMMGTSPTIPNDPSKRHY